MTFQEKLDRIVSKNTSLLCVGLDPDIAKLPSSIRRLRCPQFVFNRSIIDETHDLVCAYKPNVAFYEARGAEGIAELKMTCDYLRSAYPDIPVILDAKRADIDSTNASYATFAFDYLGADGMTLNPYLGHQALSPFLARKEKGSFILCRTSNAGASEFQNLPVGSEPFYKVVARHVVNVWNQNGNCMLVVGATYSDELADVRKIVGDMTLLIPGIGVQAADIEKTVTAGINAANGGMIVNASRSIIFSGCGQNFAKSARAETLKLRETMNIIRKDRLS